MDAELPFQQFVNSGSGTNIMAVVDQTVLFPPSFFVLFLNLYCKEVVLVVGAISKPPKQTM